MEAAVENLKDKHNVWFCPHGFKKKKRKKQHAEASHFLYADLDGINPRSTPVRPTMAVESSPDRYVGYWYVGEPVDWLDNQSWTYQIKADKGGWDPTQVLRAPESINWKYDSAPKVKVLWSGKKQYAIGEFKLKPVKEAAQVDGNKALKIFEKWEASLPTLLRRELLGHNVKVRDRSTWLWRTAKLLQQHGLTTREIFHLLWASKFNKYKERKNGEKQLKRDIQKSLAGHFDQKISTSAAEGFFSKSLAEVERESFNWVWEPYVAKGELTIFEGDPGVGKSWLAQMLAVCVADGGNMPDEVNVKRKPGIVCFLDHENSSGTVMKARLVFNGLKNEGNIFQDEQSFSMGDEEEVGKLYEALERLSPDLVIFDTVMNYAGGANVYNPGETAQMFSTFRHIALEFKCAVIVVRHLNKDSKSRAVYRGQGSITFTGTARSVIGVGYSPDDEQERLFKITKSNITDPGMQRARRFKLIPEGKECRFEWGDTLWISDEELLSNERAKPVDDTPAMEFLQDNLPREEAKLLQLAEARGFDERTLNRVKAKIGIKRLKKGKKTIWKMPRNT